MSYQWVPGCSQPGHCRVWNISRNKHIALEWRCSRKAVVFEPVDGQAVRADGMEEEQKGKLGLKRYYAGDEGEEKAHTPLACGAHSC